MGLSGEQKEWLRLALTPGVGTAHFIRLLAAFRTPGHVLQSSEEGLARHVGKALAQRIRQYADVAEVEEQERAMAKHGVSLLTLDDPGYPLRLAEIYDPPLLLFTRGALYEQDACCVAIVGTRRASPYGLRIAEQLGHDLAARGVTVVSGMAAGIDAAAHRGAIEAGGRTVAVLGCGVDVVYPPQHEELMRDIIAHGCVLSQFAMGAKPTANHFPYRNRIISGLSLGVVIVEAPLSSGALITARQAAEQGREVFAVPGAVGRENSMGPHALIREGAKLVETADDILVELDLPCAIKARSDAPESGAHVRAEGPARAARPKSPSSPPASPPRAEASADTPAPPASAMTPCSELEKDILSSLSPEGSFIDEIAAACRVSVSEALSSLTLLELRGLVRQFSGKRFAPR